MIVPFTKKTRKYPTAVPIATAQASRSTGRVLYQGDAALTKYAIARPKHCVVMNGCQNGRVSSIDIIAA